MTNDNDLKELLVALCKAQSEYPDIAKTRIGQEGHRKFKYADLNDIHKATRKINAKHGLTTPHETTDTHLITRLYHSLSGAHIRTQIPLKYGDNPKATGALLTYLKRYNIQSLLDISTEEDLDSIDSQDNKPKTPTPDRPKQHRLTNETFKSGPHAGKTFIEMLGVDSSREFQLAKWVKSEIQKGKSNTLSQEHKLYLEYAEDEGVEL